MRRPSLLFTCNEESLRPLTRNSSESSVDFSRSACIEDDEFYVEGVCGLTQCLQSGLGVPNIGWID